MNKINLLQVWYIVNKCSGENKEKERKLMRVQGRRAVLGRRASEDLTGKTLGKRPQRYLRKSVPGKGDSRVRPEVEYAGYMEEQRGRVAESGFMAFLWVRKSVTGVWRRTRDVL